MFRIFRATRGVPKTAGSHQFLFQDKIEIVIELHDFGTFSIPISFLFVMNICYNFSGGLEHRVHDCFGAMITMVFHDPAWIISWSYLGHRLLPRFDLISFISLLVGHRFASWFNSTNILSILVRHQFPSLLYSMPLMWFTLTYFISLQSLQHASNATAHCSILLDMVMQKQ